VAHSRPGGASPLCYPSDVTAAMIDSYWQGHGVSINLTGLHKGSTSAWILVVSPPRDRPIPCSPFFSRTGAVLMRAHDGGVDHHVFVVMIARQQLENAFENWASSCILCRSIRIN
jgi:hypothetical protein